MVAANDTAQPLQLNAPVASEQPQPPHQLQPAHPPPDPADSKPPNPLASDCADHFPDAPLDDPPAADAPLISKADLQAATEAAAEEAKTEPPVPQSVSLHKPAVSDPYASKFAASFQPPHRPGALTIAADQQGFVSADSVSNPDQPTVATEHPFAIQPKSDVYKNSTSVAHVQAGRGSMDLHDATGTILQQLGVNGEGDVPAVTQNVSPSAEPPASAAQPTQPSTESGQTQQQQGSQPLQAQSPHSQQPTQPPAAQSNSQQQPSTPQQQSQQPRADGVTIAAPGQSPAAPGQPAATQQGVAIAQPNVPKKPARMPGTKQCPSCQNTIAAAVAKCPKCPHVFREKKEKVKRSGKRGKKNCPKCNFENPSACSSCKNCKHVFRLKLMDKYKAMRPRQTSENVAAAAAAAAHAAANMAHGQHSAVTAVSTVPMPAGVTPYPNHISQPMHPAHPVSVIPPLAQHPMNIHPHPHNVHNAAVPQMHPLPQHPMHPHQPHPQL